MRSEQCKVFSVVAHKAGCIMDRLMLFVLLIVYIIAHQSNKATNVKLQSYKLESANSQIPLYMALQDAYVATETSLDVPFKVILNNPLHEEASNLKAVGIKKSYECPKSFGSWPILHNCNKFISCKNGIAYVESCPSNLYYNPISKECDFPKKSQCPYECPTDNAIFSLLGECSGYIVCTKGVPNLKVCELGQLWNQKKKKCEPEELVSCLFKCDHPNGTSPYLDDCSLYIICENGNARVTKCPDGMYYSMIMSTCQPWEHELCPLEFKCSDWSGHFPVLGDCRRFIECSKKNPLHSTSLITTIKTCPEGLYFNYVTEQCDSNSDGVCIEQCPKSDGIFEMSGFCNYFKVCTNGIAVLHMCPSGLHFDHVHRQCNKPSSAGCILKCKPSDTLMPVPRKCNQYVQCVHGTAEVNRCPGNLHWNEMIGACDNPQNSKCELTCPEDFGYFPIFGHCIDYMFCRNGIPLLMKCPDGLHFNTKIRMCDFPEEAKCHLQCPHPDGVFPILWDCSSYIICAQNIPVVGRCHGGLLFDAVTSRCEESQKVVCNPKCPMENGRYRIPGGLDEEFLECFDNFGIVLGCSPGLQFDPDSGTCVGL